MLDSYKMFRDMLPVGGHPETAARMAGSFVYIDESIDENSGVPGTGVEEPKDEYTAFGVRMPSKPKDPVDVRPQYAYNSDETMVGWVQAVVSPSRGEAPENRYGAHIGMDVKYSGSKVIPSGTKKVFDTEAEAKKFVSDGESVKWVRPNTVDPWESLDNAQRWTAAKYLAEDMVRKTVNNGKFVRFVEKIG